MNVRFARPALADLEAIFTYIAGQNADTEVAARTVLRLMERAKTLSYAPHIGRPTDEPDARVLIVPRLHYLMFYTVQHNEILITHVRHSSREPR